MKTSSCLNQEKDMHKSVSSENSSEQLKINMWVEFDVTFSVEEASLWIMDIFFARGNGL